MPTAKALCFRAWKAVKKKSIFQKNKVGANPRFFLREKTTVITLAPLGARDDQTCEQLVNKSEKLFKMDRSAGMTGFEGGCVTEKPAQSVFHGIDIYNSLLISMLRGKFKVIQLLQSSKFPSQLIDFKHSACLSRVMFRLRNIPAVTGG